MNPEAQIASLTKRVATLETLLETITGKREDWVKVSKVVELTGWEKERLRRARDNGEIKYRDSKKFGRQYLVQSIAEVHLKQTA